MPMCKAVLFAAPFFTAAGIAGTLALQSHQVASQPPQEDAHYVRPLSKAFYVEDGPVPEIEQRRSPSMPAPELPPPEPEASPDTEARSEPELVPAPVRESNPPRAWQAPEQYGYPQARITDRVRAQWAAEDKEAGALFEDKLWRSDVRRQQVWLSGTKRCGELELEQAVIDCKAEIDLWSREAATAILVERVMESNRVEKFRSFRERDYKADYAKEQYLAEHQ